MQPAEDTFVIVARPAERIAIAAAGVVTPVGQDVEAFWSSLVTGASGISQIERFPVGDLRVGRGGEIKKLSRIKSWSRIPDCRATRFLISAADELIVQAGFRPLPVDPARVAVVVGTALGGVEEGERALAGDRSRRRLRGALYDSPAHNLARWLGATGPFDALRSLTRDVVRPFDRRRSGLLLGEAAALVLLRRERDAGGARLGTLLGYGSASDASHIAAPDPAGQGLERAIRAALGQAGVAPADLDFVSAHGTGTALNDRVETAALKRALGARARAIPVNSIKPSMGHTMGAAATLEALMCLLASRHGLIPPTLHLEEPDPECDLDYVPGRARAGRPRISLSTSLGFGGCNAALVLEGGA